MNWMLIYFCRNAHALRSPWKPRNMEQETKDFVGSSSTEDEDEIEDGEERTFSWTFQKKLLLIFLCSVNIMGFSSIYLISPFYPNVVSVCYYVMACSTVATIQLLSYHGMLTKCTIPLDNDSNLIMNIMQSFQETSDNAVVRETLPKSSPPTTHHPLKLQFQGRTLSTHEASVNIRCTFEIKK